MGMNDVVANVARNIEIELPPAEEGIGEVEEVEEGGADELDAADAINSDGDEPDTGAEESGDGDGAGAPEDEGAVESPEVDAPAAAEEAAAEEDVDVERLAGLADAEAAVRQERAKIKAQMANFEQMQQKLNEQTQQAQQLISNLRTNPFDTLEQAGVPIDGLIKQIVDNGGEIPSGTQKHPEEDVPAWAQGMMSELKSLREEKAQAQQQQQNTTNEQAYRNQIAEAATNEKYGLLGKIFPGGIPAVEQAVFDLAAQHAMTHREVLPPSEILDTLDKEQREHIQSLSNHADALEAMGLKAIAPTNTKRTNPAGSGTETPRQNSLSGDMHPSGKPAKKGRTREEQIAIAAQKLEGAAIWPDYSDDEED